VLTMYVRSYLVSILVPWVFKTLLYHYAFRWRHIHATIQTKIIIAGAPILVVGLSPIPVPSFLVFLFAAGFALYLCKKFTDGKLYPDLALIVGGIELVALVIIDRMILPVFH
jgi:hypothetical protein